jgi:formylglycine-generating enzyme required for sulfatase activity
MHAKLSRHSNLFLTCAACCLLFNCAVSAASPDAAAKRPSIADRVKKLDPFFKQYVPVGGTLVAGSEKVSMRALQEVAYLARKLLANRPDVLNGYTRLLTVLAYTEMQSALPACRGMSPWWDYRARGLGGSTISCGEENVLCFKGDPWAGENIFIHEFGHGLNSAFRSIDKGFQTRLDALHAKAAKSGLFRGYGVENSSEFWAEGMQAWFNCNGATRPKSGGGQSSLERIGPNGEHVIHIRRREHVKKYLPGMAKLLDESFAQNKWTYVPISKRLHEPHLKGFDSAKAPTFRWPEGLAEKFYAYEDQKKLQAKMPWARVSIEQIMAAKALGAPVAFENSVGMRFVLIPPGEFMMGSERTPAQTAKLYGGKDAHYTCEHPRRKVKISKPFYMGVYEVTQSQWSAVMSSKPWDGKMLTKIGPAYPVSWVNWNEATEFCSKLSKKIGKTVTLPTEAQWEYACRAGSKTEFYYGDDAKKVGEYGWWAGNMVDSQKAKSYARLGGQKKPNAWGLYDMHGNVWEWCRDWFHKDAYAGGIDVDPEYTKETQTRAARGGSWYNPPSNLRSAARNSWTGPQYRHYNYGFRVIVID